VINVNTGSILTARGYSIGGNYNFNKKIRSMVISSGASPQAFVLSNFKTGSSCTG
jgi:hypothetical protein